MKILYKPIILRNEEATAVVTVEKKNQIKVESLSHLLK